MKLYFESQSTNTYLVYAVQETDEVDSMSLGMLTNNSIPGFAAASFMQMDTTKFIKYNVSAKVSVKQLFNGPVNKKRLLGAFAGVVDAMISAEDYMLDPASILLDTDYMFADVTTCETELVCLPIVNTDHAHHDLAMFFKNILFTTQFDQTENCDHVAQLINYLNTNPVLVLTDFKELLRRLSSPQIQVNAEPDRKPEGQPATVPRQPVVTQPMVQSAPTPASVVQPPVQKPIAVATPTSLPVTKAPAQKCVVTPPPVVSPPAHSQQKPISATENEKPMSWIYLLQHYNKENAAIYKAQQSAKKAKGAAPAVPQQVKPATQKSMPSVDSSFAVPGKQPDFAIPGQVQPVIKTTPPQMQKFSQQAPQIPNPVTQPVQQTIQQVPTSTPLNFGETTVLNARVGETTVLSNTVEAVKNDPYLIRSKNNERILLNKPVFRIGKEKSYVDYFISDNTAISRSHANIINHNGEFVVVDTNSTNHTYVNGVMIQSGVETRLSHGDKVRLANEDFEFKLY